jgi:hypothetical protein
VHRELISGGWRHSFATSRVNFKSLTMETWFSSFINAKLFSSVGFRVWNGTREGVFEWSLTLNTSPAEVSLTREAMAAGRIGKADVSRARFIIRIGSGDHEDDEAVLLATLSKTANVEG